MNTDLHKELKEQGSILAKVTKQYLVDGASVPKGYFESMESRFMDSIKSNQPREAAGFSWGRFSTAVGIAAILVVGLIFTFNYINSSSVVASQLSKNEVLDYLESENIYQEEPQLISQNTQEINLDELSKEDIKDYFIENGIYDLKTLESI